MNEVEMRTKFKGLTDPGLTLRINLTRLCLATGMPKDSSDGELELILVELLREAVARGLME